MQKKLSHFSVARPWRFSNEPVVHCQRPGGREQRVSLCEDLGQVTRRSSIKALGIQETLDLIAAAFPEAKLDAVAAFPLGTTYVDRDEIVASTHNQAWSSLSWKTLEWNHEAPRWATPGGFVAYLPAWLTVIVRDFEQLDHLPRFVCNSLIKPTNDAALEQRFHEIMALLTEPQRRAVAWALVKAEESWGPDPESSPRRALDSYWRTDAR